ncbi:hypothetical protein ACFXGA_12345 [Actinosynnema sp. NPDC059335]|uniref:hypothetical protein n=1 Tax=Actinosynnema sp. NPDC059335 TaxID=3346804 RepID=UPI00366E0886
MEPRRAVVAPELERWRRAAGPDDRRSAIVRPRPGTDPEHAADRLAAIGMEVVSAGRGSVIGNVTPEVLRLIGLETWVLAVEGPRTLRSLHGG